MSKVPVVFAKLGAVFVPLERRGDVVGCIPVADTPPSDRRRRQVEQNSDQRDRKGVCSVRRKHSIAAHLFVLD